MLFKAHHLICCWKKMLWKQLPTTTFHLVWPAKHGRPYGILLTLTTTNKFTAFFRPLLELKLELQKCSEKFWKYLKCSEKFCNVSKRFRKVLKCSGTFWKDLKCSEKLWNVSKVIKCFEKSWNVQKCCEKSLNVPKGSKMFRKIMKCAVSFKNIPKCSKTS